MPPRDHAKPVEHADGSQYGALLGTSFRVTRDRGLVREVEVRADGTIGPAGQDAGNTLFSGQVLPTIHPSAVLRADDRQALYAGLVADLRTAARLLHP